MWTMKRNLSFHRQSKERHFFFLFAHVFPTLVQNVKQWQLMHRYVRKAFIQKCILLKDKPSNDHTQKKSVEASLNILNRANWLTFLDFWETLRITGVWHADVVEVQMEFIIMTKKSGSRACHKWKKIRDKKDCIVGHDKPVSPSRKCPQCFIFIKIISIFWVSVHSCRTKVKSTQTLRVHSELILLIVCRSC